MRQTELDTRPVSDKIVEYLVDEIRDKRFEAGDKLPSEGVLAEELGVSRASIREALQKLKVAGIVETKHGKGSFVIDDFPLTTLQNIVPSILLSADARVLELLEARRFVEIGTAKLAAKNASTLQCNKIRETVDRMEKVANSGDSDRFSEMDLNFHLEIAESCNNEVLYRILQILKDLMLEQLHVILKLPGRIESSIKLHNDICKAIESGDPKLAGRLMDNHLKNAEEDYQNNTGKVNEKLSKLEEIQSE